MTALQGVRDHGRIDAGQRILIIGAAGGVGSFAVQIAKAYDTEVTGVCSTRNIELVQSLGADHVIDYTKDDVTEGGERYDLILQVSGETAARACRRVLTPKGTLLQISGDSTRRWTGPIGRIVAGKLLSSFVSQKITNFVVKPSRDDLTFVANMIENGTVTPVIDRTYSLSEVAAAIGHVETGHTSGKVVVTVR